MQKHINLLFLILFFIFNVTACSINSSQQNVRTLPTISDANLSKKLPRLCFLPNSKPLEKKLAKLELSPGIPLYIRIFKKEKVLELWGKNGAHYTLLKSYPICRYSGELGPKLKSGDKQAPEGVYALTRRSLKPNSHYHLALNINYPNRYDRKHNRDGSLIMIHGKCSSIGCFAMGNIQIEEIYNMVEAAFDAGEKFIYVAIYPFRMTDKNLLEQKDSPWYSFWLNLKTGYDMFETTHVPPFVGVRDGKYVFQQRGEPLPQTLKVADANTTDTNLTNN
jgi:murein L,D-transpeptidase YafK